MEPHSLYVLVIGGDRHIVFISDPEHRQHQPPPDTIVIPQDIYDGSSYAPTRSGALQRINDTPRYTLSRDGHTHTVIVTRKAYGKRPNLKVDVASIYFLLGFRGVPVTALTRIPSTPATDQS